MSEDAEKKQSQDGAFFELMKGYLAVGLVIGIAGLGVVMVRAVRERRREIGMLRAMGFPARTIRRAFLTEAIFVALQGIVIGSALGMLTAWSLLSFSKTFGNLELPFSVPWFDLAVLVTIPLVASAAAAALPAGRAAAIKPAVALRIA